MTPEIESIHSQNSVDFSLIDSCPSEDTDRALLPVEGHAYKTLNFRLPNRLNGFIFSLVSCRNKH